MTITPFKLERYFARHEFATRYTLSSSDCDGLPQAELLSWAEAETRMLWEQLMLGYTESAGLPLLRQEIAALYQGIDPAEVLVVVPEEGILLAMRALLAPGDHCICTFPGYQSLYQVATDLGCEVTLWKPVEERGWRFDPAFLERALRPNTRLVVCNFPHNPTGYLPPAEDWERIIAFCRERKLALFSDEMYRFLELDPATRLPAAVEEYERAVSLFGMSKTFGLAGLRLGWLVTRDRALYDRMATLKDYTTICASAPSEILALIGLRARERISARHLERIKRNLAALDRFFARHGDLFTWVRPRAGTVAFPRLWALDAERFSADLRQARGVLVLPSTVYDYDNCHFRIGYGRENLPVALAELEAHLEEQKKP